MFPNPCDLTFQLITYTAPTPEQIVRHGRAFDLLKDLAANILETDLQLTPAEVGEYITGFAQKIFDIAAPDVNFSVLPFDRPYPQGTVFANQLNLVRMCCNRQHGAKAAVGDRYDWSEMTRHQLQLLELHLATAIHETP